MPTACCWLAALRDGAGHGRTRPSRRRNGWRSLSFCCWALAWIIALTTLNGAAQAILPNWVRGRVAGRLSDRVQRRDDGRQPWLGCWSREAAGVPSHAAGRAAGLRRRRLHDAPDQAADRRGRSGAVQPLAGAARRPSPSQHDRGPGADPDRVPRRASTTAPRSCMRSTRLSAERRRDGAYGWGVTEDAADPEH